MIKKTLVVTLQEKDLVTKELHDILQVRVGNNENTVVLEPSILGKMIVEKEDLANAVREIEAFYGQKRTSQYKFKSLELNSEEIKELSEKFNAGQIVSIDQINEELAEAANAPYFAPEHGE